MEQEREGVKLLQSKFLNRQMAMESRRECKDWYSYAHSMPTVMGGNKEGG